MDSINFNYFANAEPQPYQYMSYPDDVLLQPTPDANGSIPSMDFMSDRHGSLSGGNFDYSNMDAFLAQHSTMAQLPATSVSPPAQHLSALPNTSVDSGISFDMDNEPQGRRSSSEEKESMTPAQSRRKAQNRAAQRAFRERKERHVRDLEAKLTLLTSTTSSLQSDNERLKLMLQRAQTENEILRASATSSSPPSHNPLFLGNSANMSAASRVAKSTPPPPPPPPPPASIEPRVDANRLANGLLTTAKSPVSSGSSPGTGGSNLLSASATWDFLQQHPLYLSGTVDIGEVCDRLKKVARCDGMGPMFDQVEVRQVIEQVGRSSGDQLI